MFSLRKHFTLVKIFFAFTVAWAMLTFIYFIKRESVVLRRSIITEKHDEMLIQENFALQKKETKFDNSKDQVETNRMKEKFYIAFSFSEQLSKATVNLLALTALAKHSGRQVVVPFVNNSMFFGTKLNSETQTLALYYSLSAFNSKLHSRGYSTLVSWDRFQSVCPDKLDLLIYFNYGNKAFRRMQKRQCRGKHQGFFEGFKILNTTCVDVGMLRSIETFHSEVVKGNKCVGIVEWRGNGTLTSFRALFPLPSHIHRPLWKEDISLVFNEKLLEIAHDFISKTLGSNYNSVHIRSEHILKYYSPNITILVNCIKELAALVHNIRAREPDYDKIFVAVDFLASGSQTFGIAPAHDRAALLLKYVDELLDNPVFFQPPVYNLLDAGAVAIVEMTVLASGRQLFFAGGGSFEDWIRSQFVRRNKNAPGKVHYVCTTN